MSDSDSNDFNGGTLTVSIPVGLDSAEDVLSIRHQGSGAGQIGIDGSNVTYEGVTIGTFSGGSSLTVWLNENADAAATSALINNITYQNTDTDNPTTGDRTIRFVLTDGDGGTSANYDATVTVSGVNDAPVMVDIAGDNLAKFACQFLVNGCGTGKGTGDAKCFQFKKSRTLIRLCRHSFFSECFVNCTKALRECCTCFTVSVLPRILV